MAALALLAAEGTTAAPASSPRTVRVRQPDLGRPLAEVYPETSRPEDPVAAAVLDRINADRAEAGLSSVVWDEGGSRAARTFCREQVAERTRGHFLTDGIPPYARTGFAGIFGYQSENSASWTTSAERFPESTLQLALRSQLQMMKERPPSDGHRRTILDPEATHVGIGYALARGRFQMAEEFFSRSLGRLVLSSADRFGSSIRFEGRPVTGARLEFVVISREAEPRPLSREAASARTSYAYPRGDLAYVPEGNLAMRVVGLRTEGRLRIGSQGEFDFVFGPDRPGLYTFVFYLARDSGQARPGGSATIWVSAETP